MMQLGMPIPETWMIPPKATPQPRRQAHPAQATRKLFDLGKIGRQLGWPFFLKPYDGGGWRAVTRVTDAQAAWKAYEDSGKR
jgi:biotin carboxylase